MREGEDFIIEKRKKGSRPEFKDEKKEHEKNLSGNLQLKKSVKKLIKKLVLMCKIVEVAEVSVLYVYID